MADLDREFWDVGFYRIAANYAIDRMKETARFRWRNAERFADIHSDLVADESVVAGSYRGNLELRKKMEKALKELSSSE